MASAMPLHRPTCHCSRGARAREQTEPPASTKPRKQRHSGGKARRSAAAQTERLKRAGVSEKDELDELLPRLPPSGPDAALGAGGASSHNDAATPDKYAHFFSLFASSPSAPATPPRPASVASTKHRSPFILLAKSLFLSLGLLSFGTPAPARLFSSFYVSSL